MGEKKIIADNAINLNRRAFLGKSALGVGGLALGSLLGCNFDKREGELMVKAGNPMGIKGILNAPHHPSKVKG